MRFFATISSASSLSMNSHTPSLATAQPQAIQQQAVAWVQCSQLADHTTVARKAALPIMNLSFAWSTCDSHDAAAQCVCYRLSLSLSLSLCTCGSCYGQVAADTLVSCGAAAPVSLTWKAFTTGSAQTPTVLASLSPKLRDMACPVHTPLN